MGDNLVPNGLSKGCRSLTPPAPATATDPAATTPAATPALVASAKPATKTAKPKPKPKPKRSWTERRIISELHRHGIYW